jgi:hypothetical protein
MPLKKSAFDKQIQKLEETVAAAAKRLDIDINNKEDREALFWFPLNLEAITGCDYPPKEWMDGHTDAIYFLSLACNLLEEMRHETEEEKIWSLSMGFFYVGFAGGITGDDRANYLCPSCIAERYASSQGQNGARGRDARYEPLREQTKRLAQEGNFKSRRNAAMSIAPEIIKRSKELGLNMSEAQAPLTIAGWLKDMGFAGKRNT